MADLSDVEVALVGAVTAAVYPNGLNEISVVETPVRVFRGWPLAGPLERDLAAGVSNVSVFSVPGTGHNATRWGPTSCVTAGSCTLSVQTSGPSVTFGGTGGVGQVAGVLVDGRPFVYRSAAGDTAILVTSVLAEAIRAVRTCWLSSATLTVPEASKLIGRVAADGATVTEWARQSQDLRITAWCSTPSQRDQVCSVIAGAFAQKSFLNLSDGTAGRITYQTSSSSDDGQEAGQYRRDLIYTVEYGTSVQTISPAMLFGDVDLDGGSTYA